MTTEAPAKIFDLASSSVRELNQLLHRVREGGNLPRWRVLNPRGVHAIAAGVDADVTIEIDGDVGYYCAGMNKQATVIVNGNAGLGLGENMMSGLIYVKGDVSQAAGATAHGGAIVIEGNASGRCGISMKGVDILVKGSIGPMSAFMAQAGTLTVFGDAGEALGDSIYEAKLYVRGSVQSLGADCIEKPMEDVHRAELYERLKRAGAAGEVDISDFRRYGSARALYHFHVDNAGAY
ncbi:glutamate synthase alpha subunit domain protein [Methylocella silvestris BL2]|uniref:Glutamate synthase alpha subunit domain protein n=1 Tax=Methylocella silvestris (strain DSM 15510 / CIP 108128 / LMG 27833 / NCIMB 13906 / BL2) TaxID=395965 RepID=B8EQ66_METSB|nr:protein glxC [Methylocella silvestris]ACK51556.1 glutamate synthase alpha subunit domain protein [Methylocella silvestris BL2]